MRTKLLKLILLSSIFTLPLLGCGSPTVDYENVFGVNSALDLRNVQDFAYEDNFMEGSRHGRTRFETDKDVKPRGFEDYKLVPQDDPERALIINDFIEYYPKDKATLESKDLKVYTNTASQGTTRDFLSEPTSKTYFYQWQIPEYKNPDKARWAKKPN